jgi:transcription antitermination protein NusB
MRRSDQRRDAVFATYQREVTGRPLDELLAGAKPFTRELAEGADLHRDELDAAIARHAQGWELDRIAPLERSIMRIALFEVAHRDDVPTEVALDEAVALTKRYCGADAPGFVNGVLGAAVRATAGEASDGGAEQRGEAPIARRQAGEGDS